MYHFEKLSQLIDQREGLKENGEYKDYGIESKKVRVWHHSFTKKDLAGSTAAAFAKYHVSQGWPGVGYHFIIEPKNQVEGPDGKMRARIVWAQDPGVLSYHVGNSNKIALGICVAGSYRFEKLDEPTLRSISELHAALVLDKIGSDDKSHQEMPGYSWKDCCVYDYEMAIKYKAPSVIPKTPDPLPLTYVIQQGDTFWGISGKDGAQGVQVEDLIVSNPGVDPGNLQVGQVINLGKAKNAFTRPKEKPKKPQGNYLYPLNPVVLKLGDKGLNVENLQRALVALYFYPDKAAKNKGVDGSFGPKTKEAVKRFQTVYLPYEVDGIFGPDTRSKLQAVLKSKGH